MEEHKEDSSLEKVVVHDHSYPKLHVFEARSLKFVNLCQPLPTIHLFAKEGVDESQNDTSSGCKRQKLDPALVGDMQGDIDVEGEDELDVLSVDKAPDLPLDDNRVRSVMVECEKYVNLVRLVTKHQHQEEMYVYVCLCVRTCTCVCFSSDTQAPIESWSVTIGHDEFKAISSHKKL